MLRCKVEVIDIIIKNRDFSLKLAGLAAARHRLSAEHPILPVLAAKQAAMEAGIGGEDRVADVLSQFSFPFDIHIFHDLSPSADEKFQTDTHCLTPWYGLVLEVKNISGILEFNENPPQLISTKEDGCQYGYESPVSQLQRNCEFLREWFLHRGIQLPIYGAVVLAYPKQIVKTAPPRTKLLFPNMIPAYLKSIPQQGQKLAPETFNWLSAELLKSHQRYLPKPICETYKLRWSDFRTGVGCITCGRLGMIKQPRTWVCPFCQATDPLAHQRALLEWYLIFKRTITNRECREFLNVNDIHIAKRILHNMSFKSEGDFRYRKYIMNIKNFNLFD